MIRTSILAAALMVACGTAEDGTADLLASYQAELDELEEAVDVYVVAVGTAGEVAAVGDLQITYDADSDHAFEGLEHVLEDVDTCSHMGDGAERVVEAQASLQTMRSAIEDVLDAHLLHTAVTDCEALATTHAQTMADELTAMADHHDAWNPMSCEMHEEAETHTD